MATSETSFSEDLQLFDNPNNGDFSLKGKILGKEYCSFRLYDLSGRLIKEERLGKTEVQEFNYSGVLKPGVYMLSVLDSKKKLLKNFKMAVK